MHACHCTVLHWSCSCCGGDTLHNQSPQENTGIECTGPQLLQSLATVAISLELCLGPADYQLPVRYAAPVPKHPGE